MRVLIADDHAVVRRGLKQILLDEYGALEVGEAGDAHETLRLAREEPWDIVILDIQMPGGNGMEVLRTIKQESHPPVVVMLTNHAYPQYRERCMGLGADYFLDKSREFERLVEIFQLLAESL